MRITTALTILRPLIPLSATADFEKAVHKVATLSDVIMP